MTREEEIRQEMSKIAGTHPNWSKNGCMRMGFIEGAKWADKTMIDKACEWLVSELYHSEDKYGYPNVESRSYVSVEDFIKDFKKAMDK